MFNSELVRSVVLRGSWTTNSLVEGNEEGDYTETIEILGADPIVIHGTFQLNRVASLDPQIGPDSLPMEATGRADKDGDGLPDDWEIRFGLNPNPKDPMSHDAHANYDTDIRDHYQEYMDRTNPRVDDDPPVIPHVFGTITENISGEPIANVTVALHYATQTQITSTDASGQYSFDDLVAGYYTMNFSHPGFAFPEPFLAIVLERKEFQLDITPSRLTTFDAIGFVGSPLSSTEPLTVQFATLRSTTASEPTSFTWVFGDGGLSFEKDPIYTYTLPGEYDITLITDVPGGSETKWKYIQVGVPQSVSYMLAYDVQAILGGHNDPNDPVDNSGALGYEIQAVIGTSIGQENGNTSSSQNYQLWIDEIP